MRSEIASYWAVRLGYRNVHRFAEGYLGWIGDKAQAGQKD